MRLREPWFIMPTAYEALWAAAFDPSNARQIPENDPGYTVGPDGVAVIPIYGPIARKPQDWEREYLGVVAQEDIAREIERAQSDGSVRSVLFDIDSPGGHAIGTPELAAAVALLKARKPCVAFTSGIMGSAAYYIGSQASAVVATGSAHVGCIGTVLSFLDVSGWYEQMGVKREVIVNDGATYKGMAYPGTSLTEEQRAFLQAEITKSGEKFKDAVRKARGVPNDAMRGQTLSGDDAVRARLVDQLGNFGTAYRTAEFLARTF